MKVFNRQSASKPRVTDPLDNGGQHYGNAWVITLFAAMVFPAMDPVLPFQST